MSIVENRPVIINCEEDNPVINPLESVEVGSPKIILYTHDKKPLYRQIGFIVRTKTS